MRYRFFVLNIILSLSFCSNIYASNKNIQSKEKEKQPPFFTLVVLPDTQVLSKQWPEVLAAQIEWVIDHREKDNIVFVSHVGDIVDQFNDPRQWVTANRIISRLDGVVPYGVLPGNHDMSKAGDTSKYQANFPAKRYTKYHWYVDNYRNNCNSCQLFSALGLNFVILHIECNPDDKALEWANVCLKKYSNRRAIIVTHSYLECIDRKAKSKARKFGRVTRISIPREGKSNSPVQMWKKCFSRHANVFMVLCGHRRMIQAYRQTSTGDNGNRVYEILSDYTAAKGGRDGRGGFLRLMRFYPEKNIVEVKTYSPTYDEYMQRSPLVPTLDAHEFVLPYVMTTTKSSDESNSNDLLIGAERSVARVGNKVASAWQKALVFDKAERQEVAFRAVFQIDSPTNFVSLALKKPLHIRELTLNGKSIPVPLEGMKYKTIPGIEVSLLKQGSNTLQAVWTQEIKSRKDKKTSKISIIPRQIDSADVDIHLFGLMPSALTFQTGPILGYAGEDMFTVTCRVNIPAEVVLEVNDRQYVSKPALLHLFKVKGLAADTQYQYSLKTRLSSKDDFITSVGPYSMRTLPEGGRFVFAVLGDSRTHPRDWEKVAAAVVTKKPAFSVFVGDMVTQGRCDYEWDDEYFDPAKDFFATIPYYAVIGNHEQNCPLFPRIFPMPSEKNWSQEIGSVLLIGIDGAMDWRSGSNLTKWLEDILANSKAKFIFLASHYPAWTSGGHGKLKGGRPSEGSIRLAQDVLMPLLKKYHATAMFAGHDHFYERSEPLDGVSMIITGGAGAPLRHKVNNSEKQNPYSKVFVNKFHYCLLTIDGDICTMKVFTPENEVIDTCTWIARKRK